MNIANKLTLIRTALVPVFLIILYWGFPYSDLVALAVFIIAGATDVIDGHIARKYNLVTDFGKFMDPLADKMLVVAAMCWLVQTGEMGGWVLAIVLLREFAVSGMRLVAVTQGTVIAAALSGKIKTASTIVCLGFMLAFNFQWLDIFCQVVILATSVYSGIEYFVRNKNVFSKVI